jgi:NAD-dependent deacetylase
MKNVVVFTGAGISAESGISTFRDSNGLWENHDVHDVASPEGWAKNPALVQRFYNERRKNVMEAQPNAGHKALVSLEDHFDTWIVTQNVDDLHERAGSKNILHLHGEIMKARSTGNPKLIYPLDKDEIKMGETCEEGHQLRPHIVWFGEEVPMLEYGLALAMLADIFIIVGTSMVVYPANTLVHYVPERCKVFVVDPNHPAMSSATRFEFIQEPATTGLPKLVDRIIAGEV